MSKATNKIDHVKDTKVEPKSEHKGDQKQTAKRPFTIIGEPYFEDDELKVRESIIEH